MSIQITTEFKLSQRSRVIVSQFSMRLAKLHGVRRAGVERALQDYAGNYRPSFDCPVFRNFHAAPEARRVIRLLQGLEVPRLRVVCFAAPDSATAAKWEKLLGFPRKQMTFRHPPNRKSPSARKWIAIEALFLMTGQDDSGHYKAARGFSLLMRFAARLVLVQRQRVDNKQQGDSGIGETSE